VLAILTTPDLDRALAFYTGLFDTEEFQRAPEEGPTFFVGLRIGNSERRARLRGAQQPALGSAGGPRARPGRQRAQPDAAANLTAMSFTDVTSVEELVGLLGAPSGGAVAKERTRLHELDRQWLAASPFCLLATSGTDGSCDVSPKGDPRGFTLVLDDTTIALPERPGNRRADGFRNLLGNPRVGLIYLLPGRGDTLRINGRARLVRDAPFFDRMVVRGHRPVLALVVEVEQVFHHCAKAFLRSGLWDPASWQPDAVAARPQIARTLERPDTSLDELTAYYGPSYAERLYRPT